MKEWAIYSFKKILCEVIDKTEEEVVLKSTNDGFYIGYRSLVQFVDIKYLLEVIIQKQRDLERLKEELDSQRCDDLEYSVKKLIDNMKDIHRCIDFNDAEKTMEQICHLNSMKKKYNKIIADRVTGDYWKKRKKIKNSIRLVEKEIQQTKENIRIIRKAEKNNDNNKD